MKIKISEIHKKQAITKATLVTISGTSESINVLVVLFVLVLGKKNDVEHKSKLRSLDIEPNYREIEEIKIDKS